MLVSPKVHTRVCFGQQTRSHFQLNPRRTRRVRLFDRRSPSTPRVRRPQIAGRERVAGLQQQYSSCLGQRRVARVLMRRSFLLPLPLSTLDILWTERIFLTAFSLPSLSQVEKYRVGLVSRVKIGPILLLYSVSLHRVCKFACCARYLCEISLRPCAAQCSPGFPSRGSRA